MDSLCKLPENQVERLSKLLKYSNLGWLIG
jgi:hypothetical protein